METTPTTLSQTSGQASGQTGRFDVAVVSAFGRGDWLAHEFKKNGLSVAFVDVSTSIAACSPADVEGPFGIFRDQRLAPSQLERLECDADIRDVAGGFTIWLKHGPMELLGPLAEFHLHREQQSPESLDVLRGKGQTNSDWPFARTWLCALGHQLASTVFHENASAISGEPLDLFGHWQARLPRAKDLSQLNLHMQDVLRHAGVEVYAQARIMDLQLDTKEFKTIEIKGERSGVIHADQIVWSLSSEDTYRLEPSIAESIFPRGPLISDWCWLRYQISFAPLPGLQPLPNLFVMIENVHWPWTHENLVMMTRGATASRFDAWMRLPTKSRFHRGFLEEMGARLLGIFTERIGDGQAELEAWPESYDFDEATLGAPRFPVFSVNARAQFKSARVRGLHFDGPEFCANLDWTGRFMHQQTIFDDIYAQWAKERERRRLAQASKEAQL